MEKYHFIVSSEECKCRLDKFLATNLPDLSRMRIKQLIGEGAVHLNNKPFFDCSYHLKADDVVNFSILTSNNLPHFLEPYDYPIEIVFEDEYLAVINKPPGLTVHPGAGNKNKTLVNALIKIYEDNLSTSPERPGVVHRLDKDTSGLMLIAKTDVAHFKLAEMIKNRTVKRIYHALCYGVISPALGTISTYYGRSKRDHKKRVVLYSGKKIATTHYKTMQIYENTISMIECVLETGRTHQIRVHLTHSKCPIIGDQTYGRNLVFNLNNLNINAVTAIKQFKRQALTAKKLEFVHPFTNKSLAFEVGYPDDLCSILKNLNTKNLK